MPLTQSQKRQRKAKEPLQKLPQACFFFFRSTEASRPAAFHSCLQACFAIAWHDIKVLAAETALTPGRPRRGAFFFSVSLHVKWHIGESLGLGALWVCGLQQSQVCCFPFVLSFFVLFLVQGCSGLPALAPTTKRADKEQGMDKAALRASKPCF